MGLNATKGNMYGFVTHTWNAVKGLCPHGCSYCYMKRWGRQPEVHLDARELRVNLGTGGYIFVGSSCDLFAEAIPREWVQQTLERCAQFTVNRYLFQTKNPKRMLGFDLSGVDAEVCTTLETNRFIPSVMGACPAPRERAEALASLPNRKHITIEPIMAFDLEALLELVDMVSPVQVNIGADSKRSGLEEPTREEVQALLIALEGKGYSVHKKKNLDRLLR